jgi:hypothetical protein
MVFGESYVILASENVFGVEMEAQNWAQQLVSCSEPHKRQQQTLISVEF